MDRQQAEELLTRYAEGTASDAERAMVERWYESEAAGRKLGDEQVFEHLNQEIWAGTLKKAGIIRPSLRRRLFLYSAAAAAAILLLLSGGFIWYMNNRDTTPLVKEGVIKPSIIQPGGNKAILTLGNGTAISLTDAADGELARQGDTRISKTKEGQLAYEPGASTDGGGSKNTISTPRGGQYQITLPDGSRVWLNAASVLTFPASFAGMDERTVELSGEAYFEVAKDAARPFRVTGNGNTVEVLGTQFNVNAYRDEPEVKTTLLQGAVRVNGNVLKPGQQSVLQNGKTSIRNADTEMETAWKNGEFVFNGQDFKTVMRMISRWYDADVVYEYDPAPFRIGGVVSRSRSIGEVLKMLEVTGGVKFRIEDRKIKVIR